jgi:hypothetical protein
MSELETMNKIPDFGDKDLVQIGNKQLKINRDVDFMLLCDLALEAEQLERTRRENNRQAPLEDTARQFRWTLKVFKTCLIDFDENILRDSHLKPLAVNRIAAQVYWACQYGVSFLEMVSVTSSQQADKKD